MGKRLADVGKFDVIIVNYKTYSGLEKALSSLRDHGRHLMGRVFIVDNESDSGVKPDLPFMDGLDIEWLPQRENLGFSRAVNLGLQASHSDFVMLLNPDAYLAASILEGALHIFEGDHTVAVIGPRVLDEDGTIQGSARWDPRPMTGLFGRSGPLTRWFPYSRFVKRDVVLDQSLDTPKEVDWVSGACMMVRRSAIVEVGPMDERFFMYWEDCDWCKRFRQKGYKVLYAPGIGSVVHTCGEASSKSPIRSQYHFHRSAFLLYSKYDTSPVRIGSLIAFIGCSFRFLCVVAVSIVKNVIR